MWQRSDKGILWYRRIKSALFEKDGMLAKTSFIVLPNSLRQKTSELAHENH